MRPAEGLAQTSHVLWQEQVVMSPAGKRSKNMSQEI